MAMKTCCHGLLILQAPLNPGNDAGLAWESQRGPGFSQTDPKAKLELFRATEEGHHVGGF